MDFGGERISALFCKVFFPTVLGMLSIASVSTIDGIFVGHGVGSDGIAAVNICIPLSMALMGFALMVGMGSSVVASICLASGKARVAKACVNHAMLAVCVVGVAVMSLIFAFPDFVSKALGASEHLLPQVRDYLLWFAPGLLFQMCVAVGQFALRLDGAPRLAMWCNVSSALVNVVLDWLFIFPFGWGVMGAALASTLSCFDGTVLAVQYLLFRGRDLRLCRLRIGRRGAAFFFHDMMGQCKVGVSALLGECTMAMLMFMGNMVFMHYLGDNGVGAYGISCYYLPFVFMVGNSIAQSAQPIISYNFGCGDWRRVHSALHFSLLSAVICGSLSMVAFVFCPKLLVGLFLPLDTETARIAVAGFPYYGAGTVFFVLNLAVIGYCQSIERVRPSVAFALLRGCIFLVPMFLVMPRLLGVEGIWLAMPFSEALTSGVILCSLLRHRLGRRSA